MNLTLRYLFNISSPGISTVPDGQWVFYVCICAYMNGWISKWMNFWDNQISGGLATSFTAALPLIFVYFPNSIYFERQPCGFIHAINTHRILNLEETLVLILVRISNSSKYNKLPHNCSGLTQENFNIC